MTSTTDHYAIATDVEGTQVFRAASTGEDSPLFVARCRCGWKAGPYFGPEMAELTRDQHGASCLWPKR